MALDPESLEQLTSSVRRFVRERLVPLEDEIAEKDQIPDSVIKGMAELGLFGLSVPEKYGGLGLLAYEEMRVVFELAQTSPAFRSVIGTNVGIGSQGLVMDGTEDQKQRYLPGIASGEIITSFALTEPDAGSDAGALKTTAVRDGDEYILNGTKRFITNAPEAKLFTVFARTDQKAPGTKGVSAFLIEAGTPGITLGKHDKKMGQQGAHCCDVVFDDCRVPADALLGGPRMENQGFKTAMKTMDRGRLNISAVCVGVAERLIRDSVAYATERRQFGQPIAQFEMIQDMLARSKAEAYAARCMVEETARRRDAGESVTTEASCCKLFATEMVGRVADRAVQIYGGAGYITEYRIERFYRDVRLFRLYEGTSEIQKLVIARNMIREAS
jgi:acyl-CoA dehydrogenase